MIYIAIFILGFALMRFLVTAINVIFDPRLRQSVIDEKPFVSVLIPSRNEENNIGNILKDLSNQDYSNIEILVYNDNSIDNTKTIVEQFSGHNPKIKLINAETLPEGWLGKNYGCHILSQYATGQYFLFLDADVRVNNTLIESAIAHMKKHKLGMVSIFPKQQMNTIGEKLIVPVMNVILLSLLPLILVRINKRHSLAAANGQFMLFNTNDYKKKKPHETVKSNKVEDIAIARLFKKDEIKIDCLTGNSAISCRMYTNYNEAVLGFTKNMAAFFGNSYFLSILYWFVTTFGIIFIFIGLPIGYSIGYILIALICRIFISIASEQKIIDNLIYMVPLQFSIAYINFMAIKNNYLKKNTWKGRDIK
jgi:glycosyltransferase involved in cell wall biosynthesis